MLNLEEKIRKRVAEKGITFKFLASQIEVSEAGLAKMLKNNTMKVETLNKISEALEVPPTYWYSEPGSQTAVGVGNSAGDNNKLKVQIGKRMSGRQEVYGKSIDEIYVMLLTCEKEREVYKTERDSFARERDSYKTLVTQQSQLIERLTASGQ